MPKVMVWAPKVPPGPISGHGQQFDIRFSSYYQVPIAVTAGWAAFPVYIRSPHTHARTHAYTFMLPLYTYSLVQRLSHKIVHFLKKSTKLFMRILPRVLSDLRRGGT